MSSNPALDTLFSSLRAQHCGVALEEGRENTSNPFLGAELSPEDYTQPSYEIPEGIKHNMQPQAEGEDNTSRIPFPGEAELSEDYPPSTFGYGSSDAAQQYDYGKKDRSGSIKVESYSPISSAVTQDGFRIQHSDVWARHLRKSGGTSRASFGGLLTPSGSRRTSSTSNDPRQSRRLTMGQFYCTVAGCCRAEGGNRPFARKDNMTCHMRNVHIPPSRKRLVSLTASPAAPPGDEDWATFLLPGDNPSASSIGTGSTDVGYYASTSCTGTGSTDITDSFSTPTGTTVYSPSAGGFLVHSDIPAMGDYSTYDSAIQMSANGDQQPMATKQASYTFSIDDSAFSSPIIEGSDRMSSPYPAFDVVRESDAAATSDGAVLCQPHSFQFCQNPAGHYYTATSAMADEDSEMAEVPVVPAPLLEPVTRKHQREEDLPLGSPPKRPRSEHAAVPPFSRRRATPSRNRVHHRPWESAYDSLHLLEHPAGYFVPPFFTSPALVPESHLDAETSQYTGIGYGSFQPTQLHEGLLYSPTLRIPSFDDISQQQLGLPETQYQPLRQSSEQMLHTAASSAFRHDHDVYRQQQQASVSEEEEEEDDDEDEDEDNVPLLSQARPPPEHTGATAGVAAYDSSDAVAANSPATSASGNSQSSPEASNDSGASPNSSASSAPSPESTLSDKNKTPSIGGNSAAQQSGQNPPSPPPPLQAPPTPPPAPPPIETASITGFFKSGPTILIFCLILFLLAVAFQAISTHEYFSKSPTKKDGRFSDPDYLALFSNFWIQTLGLFTAIYKIHQKAKEPCVTWWAYVLGVISLSSSATALKLYFIYTNLGDLLMNIGAILQVVIWMMYAFGLRDDRGKINDVPLHVMNGAAV